MRYNNAQMQFPGMRRQLMWSRLKGSARRTWLCCWEREWFAMLFFLVVSVSIGVWLGR